MSEAARRLRVRVIDGVLEGPGHASTDRRRAAFAHAGGEGGAQALLDKATRTAWKVTDEEVAAARQAGLTEDQLFELVVAAALGQATRQHDTALAAVAEAFA